MKKGTGGPFVLATILTAVVLLPPSSSLASTSPDDVCRAYREAPEIAAEIVRLVGIGYTEGEIPIVKVANFCDQGACSEQYLAVQTFSLGNSYTSIMGRVWMDNRGKVKSVERVELRPLEALKAVSLTAGEQAVNDSLARGIPDLGAMRDPGQQAALAPCYEKARASFRTLAQQPSHPIGTMFLVVRRRVEGDRVVEAALYDVEGHGPDVVTGFPWNWSVAESRRGRKSIFTIDELADWMYVLPDGRFEGPWTTECLPNAGRARPGVR